MREVQLLPILVALKVVVIGLLEMRCLEMQLCQKKVVLIEPLVADLDVLVDLDGLLGVPNGLLILRQLPLAD